MENNQENKASKKKRILICVLITVAVIGAAIGLGVLCGGLILDNII